MKVVQSCLTLCDPMDYTVHGILQARILEWVAFTFSRGSSQPRDQTQVSHSCIMYHLLKLASIPSSQSPRAESTLPLCYQGILNTLYSNT